MEELFFTDNERESTLKVSAQQIYYCPNPNCKKIPRIKLIGKNKVEISCKCYDLDACIIDDNGKLTITGSENMNDFNLSANWVIWFWIIVILPTQIREFYLIENKQTKDYLRIILLGAPYMLASFTLNNQLRFQGNAKHGMMGLGLGAVLNMGLDPLLISGMHLGVSGAGMIMLAMVLEAMNIPVDMIMIIYGVDRLFDMGRTTLNITGDIACSLCVTSWEKKKAAKAAAK